MAMDNASTGSVRASAAVAVADPAKHSFSFANPLDEVDEGRKMAILLFLALLAVFGFGLFCYARIGLDLGPMCDAFNASQTVAKLLSPAMLMFVLLFLLSIVVSAMASRGLDARDAVALSAVASLLPAAVLGIMFSNYIFPFIGFAVAIIATSFFACRLPPEAATLSEVHSVVSKAMLAFLVAACILTFVAVSQQRDLYFGEMLSGLINSSPLVLAQGAGVASQMVANFQVTPGQIESFVPREQMRQMYEAQVRTQVEAMLPRESVSTQLSVSVPGFSAMSASDQERLINESYAAAVSKMLNETDQGEFIDSQYAALSTQFASVKQSIADNLSDYSNKSATRLTGEQVAAVKAQLSSSPYFAYLRDFFPVAMVFLVYSFLSILLLPAKLVAGLLTYLALKMRI